MLLEVLRLHHMAPMRTLNNLWYCRICGSRYDGRIRSTKIYDGQEISLLVDIFFKFTAGVLTLAVDSMRDTVKALRGSGVDCKVIIGGAPVSESAMVTTGADEWAHSP